MPSAHRYHDVGSTPVTVDAGEPTVGRKLSQRQREKAPEGHIDLPQPATAANHADHHRSGSPNPAVHHSNEHGYGHGDVHAPGGYAYDDDHTEGEEEGGE